MDQGSEAPRACAACGYSMAGLNDDQACPECGSSSFVTIPFHGVPIRFLSTIHLGARLVTIAYSVIGIVLLFFLTCEAVLIPLLERLISIDHPLVQDPALVDAIYSFVYETAYDMRQVLVLIGAVSFAAGWWKLSHAPTKNGIHSDLANHTFSLRLSSSSLAAFFTLAWISFLESYVVLLAILTICLGLFILESSAFLRKLTKLSRSPKLSKRIARARLANFIYFAVAVLVWIIVPLSVALEPDPYGSRVMVHVYTPNGYDLVRTWSYYSIIFLGLPVVFMNLVAASTLSATLKATRRLSIETNT
jgi:hypothetical protein